MQVLRHLTIALAGWALAAVVPGTPHVARIWPNNGPFHGGTPVTISGEGFTSRSQVSFGATPARSVKLLSPDSILAVSPPGHGSVGITVSNPAGASAPIPTATFAYDPPPRGPWLGLNGNSLSYLGPIGQFAAHGVVYDRDEYTAGELPTHHDRLHIAVAHRMVPVVVIEYAGYTGEGFGRMDSAFPQGEAVGRYVRGFIRTATAILRLYPGRRILFEPINEPYGYATAAEYAAVIAQLLPAAQQAGIPLDSIYVAARDKGWVPAMYQAQPQLQTLIGGWYFHPYGPPFGAEGIGSLPRVQAEMTSGQSNIVISEIGWCALDVKAGAACGSPWVAHASDAARLLAQGLGNALAMRRAGWLRALLVYSRNDGGWAMELPKSVLTKSGRALLRFARAHPGW